MKRYIKSSVSNDSDFDIRDGKLVKYLGTNSDVVIPDGVTFIDYGAFAQRPDIRSITMPNSVTTIGMYAFASCGLETIKLSDNLVKMWSSAFTNCSNLRYITIPGGVKVVEDCMFDNCPQLERVVLAEGIEKIEYRAFANCKNLVSIRIPTTMREIEYGAFFHCTGLDRDTESKIDQLTHHAPKQSVPKQPSTLTADMRAVIDHDIDYVRDSLQSQGYNCTAKLNRRESVIYSDSMDVAVDVQYNGANLQLMLTYELQDGEWYLSRDIEYEVDDLIDYINDMT